MNPEKIADAQLAAFNDRDIDAFVACFSDDIEARSFPSGDILADRSGAALRPRFVSVFEASPNLEARLTSRIVRGSVVIDEELLTGFMGSPEPRHTLAIYDIGPDVIERVWFVS
jgi:hypothetical protein